MADALIGVIAATGVQTIAQPTNGMASATTGKAVGDYAPKASVGAVPNVVPSVVLDPVPAVQAGHFFFDFYFRIWVVPDVLEQQNPVVGVAIPFAIWNAYPYPPTNELTGITATAGDGLTFDFAPGEVYRAIEYKTVHLTITPDAPINIDASFAFEFDLGTGHFRFKATIADFVQMIPDPPVTETWAWLTDVIESRNNTEQRIALRSTPRRSIKFGFLLEDETERRRQYNRWFKSLGNQIILPYYQYHTKARRTSDVGESKLYFDPALTDLRDGEFAIVMDESTVTGHLVKIATVDVDGATLDSPLNFAVGTNMLIVPAFMSRLNDRSGLAMKMVTGHIDVAALAVNYREEFKRPGSAAVIQTYDGLPVLHLRPIANGETPEIFDANYSVIDSQVGASAMFVSWPHPVVGTTRKWTIRRRTNPADMDWWRDFLDTLLGQREPFLMPTWFADLALAAAPVPSANSIRVVGSDYANFYFPFDTFQRLQLETEAGAVIWRKVLAATKDPDGATTLTLDTPLGADPADVAIAKVSFLNKVRLANDTVTLTHEKLRTQIELAIKTVDL